MGRWWLLLVIAGCGGGAADVRRAPTNNVAPDGDADTDADADADADTDVDTDTDTDTEPLPVEEDPLPAPPFLDLAVVQQISDDIDAILAGTTRGVRVVDAENGEVVYEYAPDDPLKPASNTKLYTTAAAMDLLGEEHRLRVAAYAPAQPDAGGNVASLTVLSEHDSTWSSYVYADEWFAADRLADQLYDAGVRHVTGTLTLAGEVLVDGYVYGTYDAGWHRSAGVDVLEEALLARGITVGATATSSSFATPAGVLLSERYSPPLSVVAHPINVSSHNEMADILAHHNGHALWGGSTYADGEAAVLDFLGGLGIDTTDIAFDDGSGLSHGNSVTARATTELLLEMQRRPAGQAWERTFSIAGEIGTISGRLTGPDTWGRVYAKTGTLWDTIALSGVLYNAYDGHRYVFSILQNDVWDQGLARALADDVVEVIAGDLRGGWPPDAPVLRSVVNPGDGTLALSWDPAADADGYGIWVSSDGLVWDRADAIVAAGTSHVLHGLPADVPSYLRVTAWNATAESEPSDVYAATPSSAVSRVLVVDGNDRWDGQWENTRGAGHDFVRSTVEGIVGRTVDSASNEAVLDGEIDLSDYDAVIWTLGEESTADYTFDAAERALVTAYLDGGGNLLVSGAELGWDLEALGAADAADFFNGSLHATYVGDDAETFSAEPVPGGLFDGVGELGFYTPARLVIDWPDQLAPANGAVAELSYVGGSGGTAALSYDGAYRVVVMGFPVESIDGQAERAAVLERVLDFFGV